MTDPRLTERQRAALEAFRRLYRANGIPPTVAEVGEAIGLATAWNAWGYLEALVARGLLEKTASGSRAYRLPDHETREGLLLKGRVAAGPPLAVAEPLDEWIDVRAEVGEGAYFLEVEGDSMRDELIADGDLIIVRPWDTARHNDRVVCHLDDAGHTLKVFHDLGKKGGRWLVPRNAGHDPIPLTPEVEARIVAVYVGLLRTARRQFRAARNLRRRK